MINNDLRTQWQLDAAAPFEGWDFSYLKDRMIEGEPPWSYPDLASVAIAKAHDILDVATGGGEILASLAPFPGRVSAVEGFVPNLAVARRRLEPLGVRVFEGNTASGMPFEDLTFDLILNRHGGFKAVEMHRVLKPGGVFLTQQVGGDNLADLAAAFGGSLSYPNNTLARVSEDLTALGCDVRRAEAWTGKVTFFDVGAVVYFLRAIPWVVRGFEVETHLPDLQALQDRLQAEGQLDFTYTRFLIEALKS